MSVFFQQTGNNLKDVMTFLKNTENSILILYHREDIKIYNIKMYSCVKYDEIDIEKIKILIINCKNMPSLLKDDEWPSYIKQIGTEFNTEHTKNILNMLNGGKILYEEYEI